MPNSLGNKAEELIQIGLELKNKLLAQDERIKNKINILTQINSLVRKKRNPYAKIHDNICQLLSSIEKAIKNLKEEAENPSSKYDDIVHLYKQLFSVDIRPTLEKITKKIKRLNKVYDKK